MSKGAARALGLFATGRYCAVCWWVSGKWTCLCASVHWAGIFSHLSAVRVHGSGEFFSNS